MWIASAKEPKQNSAWEIASSMLDSVRARRKEMRMSK
jgi:hypothetical protein